MNGYTGKSVATAAILFIVIGRLVPQSHSLVAIWFLGALFASNFLDQLASHPHKGVVYLNYDKGLRVQPFWQKFRRIAFLFP